MGIFPDSNERFNFNGIPSDSFDQTGVGRHRNYNEGLFGVVMPVLGMLLFSATSERHGNDKGETGRLNFHFVNAINSQQDPPKAMRI